MTKTYTQEQVDALVANASRQMRDAAVKVCRKLDKKEKDHAAAYGMGYLDFSPAEIAEAIAALPIPGEKK